MSYNMDICVAFFAQIACAICRWTLLQKATFNTKSQEKDEKKIYFHFFQFKIIYFGKNLKIMKSKNLSRSHVLNKNEKS